MSSTQATRIRLLDAGVPFGINANVAEYLRPGEGETIQAEVEQHLQSCLRLGCGAFAARRDEMIRNAGRAPLQIAADRESYGLLRPCTNGPLARYWH